MAMAMMLCVLPLALVNARIGKGPAPTDGCFRWNETNEDALWWKTNKSVEYPVELITNDTKNNYLELVMKSASQFFGGMDQDALMGGQKGAGGFIGTSMAVAGRSSCSVRLGTTRVLIERTPTKRTFAQLPVRKKDVGMPSAIPMMNIYGLTGGEADMRDYKYAAIRYVLENSDSVSKPSFMGINLAAIPNDIAFKAKGSDEFRILECGESINNVSSLKFYMLPMFPSEFDVGNLVATFGDSKISREEIKRLCGSKTSVGCPPEGLDRALIEPQPGVEDTVLPFDLFPQTGDPKPVQVNFKRLTETVYFMDFVLPIKDGYATPDNPRGKNRFFNIEWPFDRVGVKSQCGLQNPLPPLPKSQAQCKIGNYSTEANTIRRAKPKSPPISLKCFKSGYTLCYQDDQDPQQMTRMYFGICQDDPRCNLKTLDEPWLGYVSFKPHGAALARTSNRFEIYDKQDATCISTVHAMDREETRSNVFVAAAVAVSTAVVITSTVIAIIVVATGTGGAAAGAAALLLKYGLQFRTGLSKLEDNIEKMCSDELIEVKQAPDMSLEECVEFVIQTSYQPEDADGKEKLQRKMTSLRIKTQHSVRKVQEAMLKRRKSSRASIFRKKSNRVDTSATPLVENDVRVLRDKAERSSNWSNDPAVREKIKLMTVDEAAAIMLYTQECCMYRRLNSALRAHDLVELGPYLPFMKLLLSALYKLPLVQAKVYRGVKLDLHETYNALVGQNFSWWSFSSTTLELSVLETPLFLGTEGDRTLFQIQALGVDIAAFSAMPNESEVLMLPGMRLTVQPGEDRGDGLWVFDVSVSKDVAPIIDYTHPGCRDYDMVRDLEPCLLTHDGSEQRRKASEQPETRIADDVGSFWPTIPGAGV